MLSPTRAVIDGDFGKQRDNGVIKRVTENTGKKTPGVGGKVITSRKPDDIPAFNQQILKRMT